MATVPTNFVFTLATDDHTDQVTAVTVRPTINQLPYTPASTSGVQKVDGGIKSWEVQIDYIYLLDGAVTDLCKQLREAVNTKLAFTYKQDSGTTTASNPLYSGTVLITEAPYGGAVGEHMTGSITFPVDGDVTIAES